MRVPITASSAYVVVMIMLSTIFLSQAPTVSCFCPLSMRTRSSSADYALKSTSQGETEVERLLRKARELREQASLAEKQIHEHLHEKKACSEEKIDHWIDEVFSSSGGETIAQALKSKKPCMDTLESMVDRLHERYLIAMGEEVIVYHSQKNDMVPFSQSKNEEEAARLEQMVEDLIQACQTLDDEVRASNTKTHTEVQHWGGDQKAVTLNNKWHELHRQHEEQFQKRQESFFEAQRIKPDHKPPPKVKDDHGLLP